MSEARKRRNRWPGVFQRCACKKSCPHPWSWRAQFSEGGVRWGDNDSGYRTAEEARDARSKAIEDARRQLGREEKLDPNMTVAAWLDAWLRDHAGTLRPLSVTKYRTSVRALHKHPIANRRLRTLTEADVRRWVGDVRDTVAYRTLQGRLQVLRQALDGAAQAGLLRANPAAGVKVSRTTPKFRSKVWTEGQVQAFLAHHEGDALYHAWHLTLATGIREAELWGLRWENVDLDHRVIRIAVQRQYVNGGWIEGPPKSEESDAPVRLDQETCAVLRAAWARSRSEYVLVNPDTGRPFDYPNQFLRTWYRACEAAGVPRIRFHDVRHTLASILGHHRVPLAQAKERLRHWSEEMTEHYTHALEGTAQQVADLIGGIVRPGPGKLVAVAESA